MGVYHDPTEEVSGTHLPPSFFDISTPLINLERLTAGDILITVSPFPFQKLLDIPPHLDTLRKACATGDLIQRKSGNDLLSSIHDLPLILHRMLQWSPAPWLLTTGIRVGKKGQLLIGNYRSTRWNWPHASGALDAWCDRGGCVKRLEYSFMVTEWIEQRQKALIKYRERPEKRVGRIYRQRVAREKENWITTLGAWPRGIGIKKLIALGAHLEAQKKSCTLANAITLATSDEVLDVPGWGKTLLQSVRNWYGVGESISIGSKVIIDGQAYIIEPIELGTREHPGEVPEGAVVLKGG